MKLLKKHLICVFRGVTLKVTKLRPERAPV